MPCLVIHADYYTHKKLNQNPAHFRLPLKGTMRAIFLRLTKLSSSKTSPHSAKGHV